MRVARINQDKPAHTLLAGEIRASLNGVVREEGIWYNEDGFVVSTGISAGEVIIGVEPIPTGAVVFSCSNTSSTIGRYWEQEDGTVTYLVDIDSAELNFDKYHPIKAEVQYNFKGELIVAFTDNKNEPRVVNLDHPVEPFEINSIRAFPHITGGKLEVSSVNSSGGSLLSGGVWITANYVDYDEAETPYFDVTPFVSISEDPYESAFPVFDGIEGGVVTGKSIYLNLSLLDTHFKFVQLVAITKVNGILTAYAFAKLPVATSVSYLFTGGEARTPITLDEIIVPRIIYDRFKTLTQVSDQLEWGNASVSQELNLQHVANRIIVNYTASTVNPSSISSGYKGWYANTYGKGFMPDEVYALYLRGNLKNGGKTKAFVIPGRTAALINGAGELHSYLENARINYDMGDYLSYAPYLHEDMLLGSLDDTDPTRYFETRSTANNPSASTNMGYWENRLETYPNTEDFYIAGAVDLRGQPVRHHKFPSMRDLGSTAFTPTSCPTLGITVSNVAFPLEMQAELLSWEIFFAKRDYNNAGVVGHDVLLYAALPENDSGTPDPALVWTSGGNFHVDNVDKDNDQLHVDLTHLRLHCFDLLVNRPQIQPTHVTCQQMLEKTGLTTPYVYPNGGSVSFGNDNWTYVIDYVNGGGITRSNVTDANYLRRISGLQYMPNNSANSPIYNILGEEFLSVNLVSGDVGLTFDTLNTQPGHAVNTLDYEKTAWISIHNRKSTRYASFYQQSLVSTVERFAPDSTTGVTIFNGDTFLGQCSHLTFGPRDKEDIDVPTQGIRIIRNSLVYSTNHLNLRHETPGSNLTKYFPKTLPATSEFSWPHTVSRSENVGIAYNRDYSTVNDLIIAETFDPYEEFVEELPYRIVRSKRLGREQNSSNWRIYLPNDYYEMPKNKGEIMNLQGKDQRLIINCRYAMFVTTDRTKIANSSTELVLGTGDIFDLPPVEVNFDQKGYIGCEQMFACKMTVAGYFCVDAVQGKVFVYNQNDTADEVSAMGLRQFFRTRLLTQFDNPFVLSGVTIALDEYNKRVLIAVNQSEYSVETLGPAKASLKLSIANSVGSKASLDLEIPYVVSQYAEVTFHINSVIPGATQRLNLLGVPVVFTYVTTPVLETDVQYNPSPTLAAINFVAAVDQYLVNHAGGGFYDNTAFTDGYYQIGTVAFLDVLNFGTIVYGTGNDTMTFSQHDNISPVVGKDTYIRFNLMGVPVTFTFRQVPVLSTDIAWYPDSGIQKSNFQAGIVSYLTSIGHAGDYTITSLSFYRFRIDANYFSETYEFGTVLRSDGCNIDLMGLTTNTQPPLLSGSTMRFNLMGAPVTFTYTTSPGSDSDIPWSADPYALKINTIMGITAWLSNRGHSLYYNVTDEGSFFVKLAATSFGDVYNFGSVLFSAGNQTTVVEQVDNHPGGDTYLPLNDRRYTLSFSLLSKGFVSFHSYKPDCLFSTRKGMYSLKKNVLYIHNRGAKGAFYLDETGTQKISSSWVEPVFNTVLVQTTRGAERAYPDVSKLLKSLKWYTQAMDTDTGVFREESTFTEIMVYNSIQCGGQHILDKTSYYKDTGLNLAADGWIYDRIRNLLAVKGTPFLSDVYHDFELLPAFINYNKAWYNQPYLIDKFFIARLIYAGGGREIQLLDFDSEMRVVEK